MLKEKKLSLLVRLSSGINNNYVVVGGGGDGGGRGAGFFVWTYWNPSNLFNLHDTLFIHWYNTNQWRKKSVRKQRGRKKKKRKNNHAPLRNASFFSNIDPRGKPRILHSHKWKSFHSISLFWKRAFVDTSNQSDHVLRIHDYIMIDLIFTMIRSFVSEIWHHSSQPIESNLLNFVQIHSNQNYSSNVQIFFPWFYP